MTEPTPPRDALIEFENRLDAVSESLVTFLRAHADFLTPKQCASLRQHAIDGIAASAVLRSEHEAATRAIEDANEDTVLILRVGIGGANRSDADRMVVAFKGVFFYLRALQDDLYGLLQLLLTGYRKGAPSMAAIGNEMNPVAIWLRDQLPDYRQWFLEYRGQRNDIKEGSGFAIVGPNNDLGVTFANAHGHGGTHVSFAPGRVVKLGHIARALDMSRALVELAIAEATRRLDAPHESRRENGGAR
jgi:hypothetical protein